jgi:hypothetical protein
MSDIPAFPYDILWKSEPFTSVANLTRADAEEFLPLAPRVPFVSGRGIPPPNNQVAKRSRDSSSASPPESLRREASGRRVGGAIEAERHVDHHLVA